MTVFLYWVLSVSEWGGEVLSANLLINSRSCEMYAKKRHAFEPILPVKFTGKKSSVHFNESLNAES